MSKQNEKFSMGGQKDAYLPGDHHNETLDEKLISKSSLLDLSILLPSSIVTMLTQFLKEMGHQSSSDIINDLVTAILNDLILLIKFVELLLKIKTIKDPHAEDSLKSVLEDIKQLGRVLLHLDTDHPSIINDIVTKALQPTEEKSSGKVDSNKGIVKVDPKPGKGVLSQFVDWAVDQVIKFLNLKDSNNSFTQGNYAPVRHETPPTADVIIKGSIPMEINGVMVRNGPNPQFDPIAKYSWLDGDSMLHAVYFKKGKATYASRYIQTSRFKQEKSFGKQQFLQYGDLRGSFGVFMACVQLLKQKLGILDMSQGWFNANTNAMYHSGFLMAFEDFDKPYAINVHEDGDLETLGINNYNNKLTHNCVAHPKKDLHTGEMFILGSSYTSPYAVYNVITKDGIMSESVRITTSGPTYMHDFGITKKYIIFMDLSYCFNPENMVKNNEWVYNYDRHKKARFGILPRNEKNENKIKWFEFNQPFFIFHNGNSWEEDEDTIILISCIMEEPKPNDSMKSRTNFGANNEPWVFYSPDLVYNGLNYQSKSIQGQSKNDDNKEAELALPTLNKLSFNMKTGICTRTQLTKTPCDYPKVNEGFIGRSSRFVYTSEFNEKAEIIDIVKTDLQWNSELKLNLGEGKYSSEVTFVPRDPKSTTEEDGYLTTFVYDKAKSKSFAYVICALKMEILATVELTNITVPYGFHATFVTEEELKEQRN